MLGPPIIDRAGANARSPPMKCPVDNTVLVISERQGVEIDYCPQCRGVWLDRGELDKIIERAPGGSDDERDRNRYEDRDRYEDRGQKPKKKKSFLSDIFEFGE
jgi:Zn-finger nucleic acid-binding protein